MRGEWQLCAGNNYFTSKCTSSSETFPVEFCELELSSLFVSIAFMCTKIQMITPAERTRNAERNQLSWVN